jgi:hypothetical protein
LLSWSAVSLRELTTVFCPPCADLLLTYALMLRGSHTQSPVSSTFDLEIVMPTSARPFLSQFEYTETRVGLRRGSGIPKLTPDYKSRHSAPNAGLSPVSDASVTVDDQQSTKTVSPTRGRYNDITVGQLVQVAPSGLFGVVRYVGITRCVLVVTDVGFANNYTDTDNRQQTTAAARLHSCVSVLACVSQVQARAVDWRRAV